MAVWPLPRITFRELSSIEEKRPVALLTNEDVWAVLGTQLTLPVVIQAEPDRYNRDLFDYLADNLPASVKVLYAVGQDAPVEAGKFVASRRGIPLVVIPTALDSDRMLTPFALVEDQVNDHVRLTWEETGPASEVIIDWGLLESAEESVRGGGIVEVIAIVTALLDWRYAAQKGKNPREQRFEPWAASIAAGLASQAIKNAAAIGQGDSSALGLLLNLMMIAVQLTNQLQHTRARQGAEHYLAHAINAQTGLQHAHSAALGPCMLLVSALHGQDPGALRSALEAAGVPLDQMRPTDVKLVLDNIAALIADYELPYSILNDIDPASEDVAKALDAAGLEVAEDTWHTDTGAFEPVTPETNDALADTEAPHESKPDVAPAPGGDAAPDAPGSLDA